MQASMITPFACLAALEESLLLGAKSIPYHENVIEHWVGVSFLSGHNVLLTPLDEVIEILPVPVHFPVPGVKPWLRGMVSSHGELFALTDLNGFLSAKNSSITHYSRILVVETQEEKAGFLVDRVLGLQRIPCEDQSYDFTTNTSDYAAFMIGSFIHNYVELPIISCKNIMHHPKFRDVAIRDDELFEVKK